MNSSIARLSAISLFFLLLLAIAAGCVQQPLPALKAPAVVPKPLSPQAQIAELENRAHFWRNFQCKLRIEVNGKTAKFSAPAIVLVKEPNFVRFETFTPIGTTAALYVSSPTGHFLLIPSRSTLYTAKQPGTLAREFLGGVSLPVDLFGRLLSASIPPGRLENIHSRLENGLLRLISRGPTGYFEWQVAAGGLDRVFIGSAQFEGEISYDPPVPLAKEAAPEIIRLHSKGWSMQIHVEKMRPAARFQPGAFRLPVLSGVRRVALDGAK